MTTAENAVQFGTFEFNFKRQELTKSGFRVRLSASQLRLLTLFLERPGELITRDQIINRIWSHTGTIDTATGINTAINRLRTHLSDDPSAPTYIETVIGLGYRFIAPLTPVVAEPATPPPPPSPEELFTPETGIFDSATLFNLQSDPFLTALIPERIKLARRRRTVLFTLAAILLLALLAVGLAYELAGRHKNVTNAPLVPLTFNRPDDLITSAAVSPSGDSIAYADNSGISVHWFDTRPTRLLAPIPDFTANHLSWFPDGNQLLVSGINRITQNPQVWLVPLMGAYIRAIAQNATLATISPDGSTIAFAKADNSEIWTSTPDGQHAQKLLSLSSLQPGLAAAFLLWSPDSSHLVLSAHPAAPAANSSPWIYASVSASTGDILARQNNLRIESAYFRDSGLLSFVTGDSFPNPTARQLYSVPTDPSTGRILAAPTPVRDLATRRASSLSASLDGTRVASILERSNVDVFTATLQPPSSSAPPSLTNIQRLTQSLWDAYPHAWTQDDAVVFETSLPDGRLAIYQQSVSSQTPTLVAEVPHNAAMAQLSPDGRFILFLEFTGYPSRAIGLFRVPITGGQPTQVPTTGPIEEFHCPRLASAPCVLREAIDGQQLVYYALDPLTGIGPVLARTPWQPYRLGDWGISPDGTIISAADHDTLHPAVHLIPLGTHSSLRPSQPRDIPVTGHGLVLGANWTAEGNALFLQTRTPTSDELLFHDLSGTAPRPDTVLRSSPLLIWAVASPDGHHIAFPAQSTNTNVWTFTTP